MFKKIWLFAGLAVVFITGCVDQGNMGDWGAEYESEMAGIPMDMAEMYDAVPLDESVKTVSVLLPLSGSGGELGTGMQHAIEIAFFQHQPPNTLVSFHDLSGRTEDKERVIDVALAANPDLIIGPVFADDVELLRSMKPADIPALTFTSARRVLGGGIFTMALLPNQAIEAIVKQIKAEGRENVVIAAPDTTAGYMLANSAVEAAAIYNVKIAALYLYIENDTEDLKDLAARASLSAQRKNNLTRAKEILSEILIKEQLTVAEKELLKNQLEDLNKRDSLGGLPYDAMLMLGNANDSRTLGAYLRYFDASAGEVYFYGSALWDSESIFYDAALSGGEYAAMPRISESFVKLYAEIEGMKPGRMQSMAYDSATLAIKALAGSKPAGAHLLDSSGYVGLDGLVRLKPSGENERALQIMQLDGVRAPAIKRAAAVSFKTPLYKTSDYDLDKPARKKISTDGYSPTDYVRLPGRLAQKYKVKKSGAVYDDSVERMLPDAEHVEDVADSPEAAHDETFKPVALPPVNRRLIDKVKMRNSA